MWAVGCTKTKYCAGNTLGTEKKPTIIIFGDDTAHTRPGRHWRRNPQFLLTGLTHRLSTTHWIRSRRARGPYDGVSATDGHGECVSAGRRRWRVTTITTAPVAENEDAGPCVEYGSAAVLGPGRPSAALRPLLPTLTDTHPPPPPPPQISSGFVRRHEQTAPVFDGIFFFFSKNYTYYKGTTGNPCRRRLRYIRGRGRIRNSPASIEIRTTIGTLSRRETRKKK